MILIYLTHVKLHVKRQGMFQSSLAGAYCSMWTGLAAGGHDSVTVNMRAEWSLSEAECEGLQYMCVYVTTPPNAPYISTQSSSQYRCHQVNDNIKDCDGGRNHNTAHLYYRCMLP